MEIATDLSTSATEIRRTGVAESLGVRRDQLLPLLRQPLPQRGRLVEEQDADVMPDRAETDRRPVDDHDLVCDPPRFMWWKS